MKYYLAECSREDLDDFEFLKNIKIYKSVDKDYILNWVENALTLVENNNDELLFTFSIVEWDNNCIPIQSLRKAEGSFNDILECLNNILDNEINKDSDFCIYKIYDKKDDYCALIKIFSILTESEYVDLIL